jgi:hypothetical protein
MPGILMPGYRHFHKPFHAFLFYKPKTNTMKSKNMLVMAALSIFSVSAFAQDSTQPKMKTHTMKMEKLKYSCPMHPDVTSNKPGKCSKCGMALVKTKKNALPADPAKTYVCPMHPDVTSNKPGKCSKCGMALKEKEPTALVYYCPMKCEGEKTYDKPGRCPVCGMNLVEKKDDHANHKH